jgi:hypothetical protein
MIVAPRDGVAGEHTRAAEAQGSAIDRSRFIVVASFTTGC